MQVARALGQAFGHGASLVRVTSTSAYIPPVLKISVSLIWLHRVRVCCLPRPRCNANSVFTSTLCPERIIHPHPTSLVNPPAFSGKWLRNEVNNVILLSLCSSFAFSSSALGITGNSLRYVTHGFDPKSSRKSGGHAPGVSSFSACAVGIWDASTCTAESDAARSTGSVVAVVSVDGVAWSDGGGETERRRRGEVGLDGDATGGYSRPNSHMGCVGSVFRGSGSHR